MENYIQVREKIIEAIEKVIQVKEKVIHAREKIIHLKEKINHLKEKYLKGQKRVFLSHKPGIFISKQPVKWVFCFDLPYGSENPLLRNSIV